MGIFFGDSFLGSTRSNSEQLGFFEGGGFLGDSFFGSTRSGSEHSDFLRVGIFGSTRSSSEHSDFLWVGLLGGALGAASTFWGWGFWGIIFDWFCRIFGLETFVL